MRSFLIAFLVAATAPALGAPNRTYYYDRAITPADLDGRPLRDLAILRNTIFARAGHTFRKQWLKDYFAKQPWYQPAPSEKQERKVSQLDRDNAATIAKYELALPRTELEKRRDALAKGTDTDLTADEAAVEKVLLSRALGEKTQAASPEIAAGNPMDDPTALDRQLTVDQLKDMSRRDLRILRNTVYARRGRRFKSDILQQYFDRMEWYQQDPSYSDKKLSKLDQRNIAIIRSVEDSLGGPLSDDEHKQEDGWMMQA